MHTHICICMYACAYICIDGFLSSDVNTWEKRGEENNKSSPAGLRFRLARFIHSPSILLSKVTSSRGQYWKRDRDYYLYNLSHFWPCYTVILLYTYISIILD